MKTKLFSRVTAVVLTLAMLIPCLSTVPAFAAEDGVTNLFHYKAAANSSAREEFMTTLFPNNVVDGYGDSSNLWRIFQQYSYTVYQEEGPKKVATQAMQFSVSPNRTTEAKAYSGRPTEILADGSKTCRLLDAVRFELGGVDYPIVTKGMEALNLSFTYLGNNRNLGLMDEFKVYVSLDGKTWLSEGAGIRSHKLLGAGTKGSSTYYMYQLETDSLFDIDGLNPGDRIVNIKVEPYEVENVQATELQFYTMDLNAYTSQADFDRLVPADVREYVHVGEETMRRIVVEEGQRTANVKWTTDSEVHTITGSNHIQHMPGVEYRGCTYERDIDSSRELFESAIVDGKWMGGNNQDNFYGMDCQTFVYNAASRVSRALGWACENIMGAPGMTLVGKEFLNIPENGLITYTNYDIIRTNTQQDMFKAYALAKPGDTEVQYNTTYDGTSTSGSHVRIVVENHTVYNEDGTIDGAKSYFLSTEQAMFADYEIELADGTRTTFSADGSSGWTKLQNYLAKNPGAKVLYGHAAQANSKQIYNNLHKAGYAVYTNDYYAAGDIELQNVEAVIAPKTAGKSIEDGGVFITTASNYRIIGHGVKLEDMSSGEVLYDDYALYKGANSVWGRTYSNTALDTKLTSLSNGSYRLSLVVDSGPFTALGQSKVPTNVFTYDFIINDRDPRAEVTLNTPESVAKGQTVSVDVKVSAATDAANVDVKFDTDLLNFQRATSNDNVIVNRTNGIINIMAVDAGVSAGGTLTTLTFTAKDELLSVEDAIFVKSAAISSADAANTGDATKATDGMSICPSINFNDVSKSAWYHEAVDFVLDNNVMSGFGGGRFAPDDKLDRAQVVQVLYNYEGQPATEAEGKFRDVKTSDWYFNATRWGANKGVVTGYGDGSFKPNDKVTIEQVAVILHNYSGKPAATADLSDLGKYDDWAANGLQWAVANGVLKNVPFTNATETATRAQTAQMLTNFLSK